MQHQFLAQCISFAHAANGSGQHDVAVKWCQQALQLAPNLPEAWYNLGLAFRGLGKTQQARDALLKAAALVGNNPDAQNSIGLQFIEVGAFAEAERCLQLAIALAPGFAFAYSNMCKLREKQRRFGEAEVAIRKAIELQPALAALYVNLGGVLNARKSHLEAAAACRRAIELDSNSAEAWSNLAAALHGLTRYGAAEDAGRKAVDLDPGSAEAWANLGAALVGQKRHDAAIPCLAKSLELDADGPFLFGQLLHSRMYLCDWRVLDADLARLIEGIGRGERVSAPFPLVALTTDAAAQRQAAEIYVAEKYPAQPDLGPIPPRPPHDRIRIGYYSADYHDHATAYLMAELFELHDRDRFELIAFSFGPEKDDEMRQRISVAFGRFIDVRDKSDREVAQLSRDLEIDIAVDLKGYTGDSRPGIFACRAAPVQVNYLGFPGTMGASYIDYIVADETLIPESCQRHYTEKVAYLPNSYQVNDAKRRIADTEFTREQVGLPEKGFVFCCFNGNYKIVPGTFDGWTRILRQVEGSVLWLYEGNPLAAENLRKEAQQRGIDPGRLVFAKPLPLSEHLARHRLADLFLDTLPCNAHTTTSDALWAGLPVLTLTGESFASRVAASLLRAIGLAELVTATQEDYEALAIDLARNPDRLAQLRQQLERNRLSAPLFDTRRFARNLEAAYAAMYERYRAGQEPEHIHVPDAAGRA